MQLRNPTNPKEREEISAESCFRRALAIALGLYIGGLGYFVYRIENNEKVAGNLPSNDRATTQVLSR